MQMFPGDHFFLNGNRAEVLQQISRELRPLLASLDPAATHGW
jgi:surfactin synthase thioesterase subunit